MKVRFVRACNCTPSPIGRVSHIPDGADTLVDDYHIVCSICNKRYTEIDELSYQRAMSSLSGRGYDPVTSENILRGLMQPPTEFVSTFAHYIDIGVEKVGEVTWRCLVCSRTQTETLIDVDRMRALQSQGTRSIESRVCSNCGTQPHQAGRLYD